MHGVKMAMEDSLDGGMLFSRTELTTPLCTLNDSQQNPFTSPPRQVLLPLSPRTAKMVTLTPLHFGQYDDPQELTKGLHQMMKTFNELSSQQSQELAQVKRHLEALNKQPDQGVPDTIWVEELYCLDGERDELPDYLTSMLTRAPRCLSRSFPTTRKTPPCPPPARCAPSSTTWTSTTTWTRATSVILRTTIYF